MTVRPQCFISSVIEGFEAFREAARNGVLEAGWEPVRINEVVAASEESSRNLCIDAAKRADGLVLILAAHRDSWVAPSGRTVVEEEYRAAREAKRSVFVFIQDGNLGPEAARFARELTDYTRGHFIVRFKTPDQLRVAISSALTSRGGTHLPLAPSPPNFLAGYDSRTVGGHEPIARICLTPIRREVVFRPAELAAPELGNRLIRLAFDANLFDVRAGSGTEVTGDILRLFQPPDSRTLPTREVRISCSGDIILSGQVGRNAQGDVEAIMHRAFALTEEDLEDEFSRQMSFAGTFYETYDPYRRFDQLRMMAGVLRVGSRKLLRQSSLLSKKSGFNIRLDASDVVAYGDSSHIISRLDLLNNQEEIADLMALLRVELA